MSNQVKSIIIIICNKTSLVHYQCCILSGYKILFEKLVQYTSSDEPLL